jgi:hypothetical protein
MTMSGQAQWFKAPSYIDVDDQWLIHPWWGLQPGRFVVGLGVSVVSPPPLIVCFLTI